jgi:lipocalin
MENTIETVRGVDINRYLGQWYEIARFDHFFERGMVGVTAYYSLNDDGTIQVVNSGYKCSFFGKFKSVQGKAHVPDPADAGKLRVSFFLWFYSDYYILELDEENYSYALVGSSSDKYLWILSRTPVLDRSIVKDLLHKAKHRGYDVSKLIWVKQ